MKGRKNYRLLERLHGRFKTLYEGQADRCLRRLEMMIGRYGLEGDSANPPYRWSHQDAFLITYADTLRSEGDSPLNTLREFLAGHVRDAINTVHILPFFPYSSDDGFSVIDYRKVDPELGSWNDIRAIASEMRVMGDLVINHISRQSRWFQDYCGGLLPEKDYFIEADPADDLSAVVRPRSLPLLTPVHTRDGLRHVWTTFSDDQIDLDFSNPDVLFEFLDILMLYARNGIKVIRLDAIAYLWKKTGTSCIHRPETHELVRLIRDFLELIAPDVTVITETNVPHEENISYFGRGDEAHMVYQFPLPPLLLHAILTENTDYLRQWAAGLNETELPEGCTFFNFTASHDGIGVRPLEGLIPVAELKKIIDDVRLRGGHVSTRTADDGKEKPYELNITYFDAVSDPHANDADRDIERFLCTQAVALALKGVPAVYIHSLLGTRNDMRAVEETGRPRSINRSRLDSGKLGEQLQSHNSERCKVFRRYKRLLHCRTQHRAFDPRGLQVVHETDSRIFALERTSPEGDETLLCLHNLSEKTVPVTLPDGFGDRPLRDAITGDQKDVSGNRVELAPFRCLWLLK